MMLISGHNNAMKSSNPSRLHAWGREQRESVCVWPQVARSIWHCAECAVRQMKTCTNKHSSHSLCTETYKEDGALKHRRRADNMIDYKWSAVFVSPLVIKTNLCGSCSCVLCMCLYTRWRTKGIRWGWDETRRRRHLRKGSYKDWGCEIHTFNTWSKHGTHTSRRPSPSNLIASLLKAGFNLFQPERHGHDHHFHLERIKSRQERRRMFWKVPGKGCQNEQQGQRGRNMS